MHLWSYKRFCCNFIENNVTWIVRFFFFLAQLKCQFVRCIETNILCGILEITGSYFYTTSNIKISPVSSRFTSFVTDSVIDFFFAFNSVWIVLYWFGATTFDLLVQFHVGGKSWTFLFSHLVEALQLKGMQKSL